MSWLYSLVLAGLIFSQESDLMNAKLHIDRNGAAPQIVKLDETERFEQTYPFSASGRVNVSNVNGPVTVEAWDKKEIKLEAVKIGDSRESLAEVEIKIDAQPDSFSVEADYGDWKRGGNQEWKNHRKLEVQFRLSVPRTAVLDEIETVNGSVTVSNFVNYTKVSAVNGQVKATNLRGTASLSTVNGEVAADFDRLEAGSKISLEAVNGRVNLLIPSDSNATIKADTLNGNINNDFGLPVRKGEYVGKDLYGRIGKGDVQIKMNSVNGGLSINRKADGKNPSQPVNLLNDKAKDEEDWDWDDDNASVNRAKVNTAKINREVARAVKDSQKDVAKAMKEAEKELKNIQPEIAVITNEAILQSLENIDSAEMQKQIQQAQVIQKEALARLADINWTGGAPVIEKKSETFNVKGKPKVTIDAKGCAVSVRGWDRAEVQYAVKKFSRSSRNQPPVESKVEHDERTVSIKILNRNRTATDDGDFFNEAGNVRVEVFVPKKSDLKIVTNGEIRLENVSGEIDLSGADEAINVRDVDGKLSVASVDGRVRIVGFRGELIAQSVDGETYLEGDFQKISARSGDGKIYLTLPETINADFLSNTEIESDGFELIKEDEKTWRAGRGGAQYNFTFADGNLIVRGVDLLKTN